MRIYLRPVAIEDGKNIVKWRNSPAVREHCFDKREITLESNAAFYKSFIETGKYKQFIVERIEEQFAAASYPIATVYLKDIDEINKRAELCIYTSDDSEWNTESRSIAVKLLLEKAFTEYKLHKIYTYVFASNTDEAALLKNSGFQEEALLKQEAVNTKGEYVDILRMSIILG